MAADVVRTCERCGKEHLAATFVWLELDSTTGTYYRPGTLPAGARSQGLFAFGPTCARRVLAAAGDNRRIRKAAR
jgi:hypothetical protein